MWCRSRCVSICTIQVLVVVRLPAVGEYGLEIYASDPLRDGDIYTHICQYLVAFSDRDFGVLYGQLFDRLDLVHGVQAEPLLSVTADSQYASLQYNGRTRPSREMMIHQDSAPAKDHQPKVRTVSARCLHYTSVLSGLYVMCQVERLGR